jgi:hypothetical protein
MAMLFAFAALLQYNDPDPFRWVAVYGAACAVSLAVAARGAVHRVWPLAVGAIALTWGLVLLARASGVDVFTSMFDAWEMRSVPIEEAREASGLLIVAVWMGFLAATMRSVRRPQGPVRPA